MLMLVMQELEIKKSKFTTEVRAGLTSFFTMAYIIAVNVGRFVNRHTHQLIWTGFYFSRDRRKLRLQRQHWKRSVL